MKSHAVALDQTGRTLIELLVAIALGLLILLGVGSLFLGANQSARTVTGVAAIEENGQIALALLGSAIRRAGYSEIIGTESFAARSSLLYDGDLIRGCSQGQFANISAGNFACTGPTAGATDSLVVWFQGENVLASAQGDTQDCLGNKVPDVPVANVNYGAAVPSGNIPLVRNAYFVQNGQLKCAGSGSSAPQPLLNNVVDFRVFYGFDDTAYGALDTTARRPAGRSIVDATTINGLPSVGRYSAWDFVVSVHVCVVVRTEDKGVSSQSTSPKFRRCPANAAEAAEGEVELQDQPADGSIRRSYMQVFAIRSRATPSPAI